MKKYLKYKTVFLLCFSLLACDLNDDNGLQRPQDTIADVVEGISELSSLTLALERAGLVSTLEANGSFTLLAPSNAAFNTFLESNNFDNLEAVPTDVLEQVLLNHVLIGEFRSTNLLGQFGYVRTLASGPIAETTLSMLVNGTDGIRFNGLAQVTQGGRDILAANGSVHIIDAVLALPTVTDFVSADPNFMELNTALTTATPSTDYPQILSGAGLFTVFGPLDAAFDMLLATDPEWNSLEDIDEAVLNAVLGHHVIGGANILSTDIQDGLESPATLEGDTLTFTVSNNGAIFITDGSDNSDITITGANIQASNGVLHTINRVMIPNTEN